MDLLVSNAEWMVFNVSLAFIPVIFGFLMLKNRNLTVRLLSALIWIVFLPNTSYLFTDITHFFEDAGKISGEALLLDLFMYLILIVFGVLTFTLSIYPFEKMVVGKRARKRIRTNVSALFLLNLLVGFGMVLGRVQRTNSWEIFTNTGKVIVDSLNTLKSWELISLAVVFAVFCQIVYETFAKTILKNVR